MDNNSLEHYINSIMADTHPTPTAKTAIDAALTTITNNTAPSNKGAQRTKSATRIPLIPIPGFPRKKHASAMAFAQIPSWIRAVATTCIVCLGISGTAYAADALGFISLQQTAPYQIILNAINPDKEANKDSPATVDNYSLELAYEPKTLSKDPVTTADETIPKGQHVEFFSQDFSQSLKVSILYCDTDEALAISHVAESETIDINGRSAILIKTNRENSHRLQLFIPYPNENRIVSINANDNLYDEAIAVAQGISLVPNGTIDYERLWLASDYIQPRQSSEDRNTYLQVSHQQMEHLHHVGETFALINEASNSSNGENTTSTLQATVAKVEKSDTLTSLSCKSLIPDEWYDLANPDGTLKTAPIVFKKQGDGINTLDETIETNYVPLKLIHVSIDYTNNTDKTLNDVSFFGGLVSATENKESYTVFNRADQVAGADKINVLPKIGVGEMIYYDVNGTQPTNDLDHPNYLTSLQPGQTATVHMAWLVPQDEANQLFLTLNSTGTTFDNDALKLGYVDLRSL